MNQRQLSPDSPETSHDDTQLIIGIRRWTIDTKPDIAPVDERPRTSCLLKESMTIHIQRYVGTIWSAALFSQMVNPQDRTATIFHYPPHVLIGRRCVLISF